MAIVGDGRVEVREGRIAIFDQVAELRSNRWHTRSFTGHMVPVRLEPIAHVLQELLDADRDYGNIDDVAMAIMGPAEAIRFFAEGLLSVAQISAASQGVDYIDIPDFEIDGVTLTLRIMRSFPDGLVTADSDGNPI